MTINPFLEFAKYAGDPRKALFIKDVDLAIQPSMSTETTKEQRDAMWQLYEMTEGGVLIFTGRTPQSANQTFGHDYPGVFEHYSLARFGLGQSFIFMAPKIDVEKMAGLTEQALVADGTIRIATTPADIRDSSDRAVYIEKKNASIALVHTTLAAKFDGDPAPLEHLKEIRKVLNPVAAAVLTQMGLNDTHKSKQGNDAVEMVPNGLDKNTEARFVLTHAEMDRIEADGLSKATALHNFYPLYEGRIVHMLGDGAPDLDVAVEIKKHFEGKGTYVSNGVPLQEKYKHAVDHTIDHHSMTWPLIIDTAKALYEAMPKTKLPLPAAGGAVPNLSNLQ